MTQQPFPTQDHGYHQGGQPPYRQLRRSRHDRKIAGVCSGVADYLAVDPTLIRVAFVVLSVLTGGVFVLAYLFAYLVMPESPPDPPVPAAPPAR
jgi:phage shock protein C